MFLILIQVIIINVKAIMKSNVVAETTSVRDSKTYGKSYPPCGTVNLQW